VLRNGKPGKSALPVRALINQELTPFGTVADKNSHISLESLGVELPYETSDVVCRGLWLFKRQEMARVWHVH